MEHVLPPASQTPVPGHAPAWDVLVVGGGAAGLTAGLFAARAGARVLVVESRPHPGTKIRISGGGRCNVLPSTIAAETFFTSGSPNTLRNILTSWPLSDLMAFFEADLGVPLKREATGKLFPVSDRAQDVIVAFVRALAAAGGTLRCHARVSRLQVNPKAPGFTLTLADGAVLTAAHVILATGGLSVPKTGSDGAGWRMATALGHTLQPPHAALVPLHNQAPDLQALRGVACVARLEAHREGRMVAAATGDLLFTHRGYSGPVVLNISRQLTSARLVSGRPEVVLRATWQRAAGDLWADAWQRAPGHTDVGPWLRGALPRRLADVLLQQCQVDPTRRLCELTRPERQALRQVTEAYVLPVSGDEGFRTAEVTAGGIGLDQVHTKTLESRLVPGLFIAGEALDVSGALGGYNFLWSWVSGRRAGAAAARPQARRDAPAAPVGQSLPATSAA